MSYQKFTHTHTFAVLPVSKSTYDEIKKKLEDAGYQDQFQEDDGEIVIDMHGIALSLSKAKPRRVSGKRQAEAMQRLMNDAPHGRY